MDRRIALVTGGSGDLGASISLALAKRGMVVAVHYNRHEERAQGVVDLIEEAGGEAQAFGAELGRGDGARDLVDRVVNRWNRLDVLVNAAGGNHDVLLMMMKDEEFDSVIESNLRSAFNVSRAAIRPMIAKRWGRIVNVTSVSAWVGLPGQTNYAAAKAGLIGFTKALAAELGKFGILVNAVAPGAVESEAINALAPERKQKILEGIPLGRLGRPSEIAQTVSFLASDEASYITGQVLAVSGGLG